MTEPAARPARRSRRRRRGVVVVAVLLLALVGAAAWQRANPFVIETRVDIAAPPEVVWGVLTDFEAYPEWNPGLVGMTGELEVGQTLRFSSDATDDALTFEPVVREVRPGQHLRWEGSLLVPGLFDGEHAFDLEPLPGGGTRLTQSEHFRGVFVPFLTGWLDDGTRQDFLGVNAALHDRSLAVLAAG